MPIHKFIHKHKRPTPASVKWLPHENRAHPAKPLYGKWSISMQQSLTIQPKAALPIKLKIGLRLFQGVCSVSLKQSLKEKRCSLQDGIIAESVDDIIVTIKTTQTLQLILLKVNLYALSHISRFKNIKMEYKDSKCNPYDMYASNAKLYPSLPPVAVPSAPEPTSVEGTAQSYRLQKINEIQKEIATERDQRANLSKKYHRAVRVIAGVDNALVVSSMVLGAAGIGVLSTIIAAPVVIAMEGAAIGIGLLSIIGGQTNKKLLMKAEKHEKI
ncbi:hypothetical protein DPMN_086839 [Dreissena polymorpha]|uniref:Uncharacterized protein n=1 Tax=Dreissena polymorpha TaxID=45954 RepID=A0A9D4KR56_DREPO|nr:hypothetical protein DPMN_086839 [Dreissena polymorpha]